MPRILYLSRGGYINGSQRQLLYVVSNLDRNLYEPTVVCPKDGQFVEKLIDRGISSHVIPLRPWRKFPAGLYRYSDAWRLLKFAKEKKFDLIHSSDLWLNGYLTWVTKRLKIPSVLHVRTPLGTRDVQKHRCDRATSIIAISRRIKQNLLQAGVTPEKISVIDDSVELDAFRLDGLRINILRRDFAPKGEILIGIVGRIEPLKNQLAFLKAAEQVRSATSKSISFFVIGEIRSPRYFEQLRRLANSNGLKKYVFFTNRRDDMPQVIASLDILVSLSGGSIMFEAMACGKPVVSAGFSSKNESVHIQDGKTGLIVDSKQSSELARALVRLIEAPELRSRIGCDARKWTESHLSHNSMVAKTQQLYRQLLKIE